MIDLQYLFHFYCLFFIVRLFFDFWLINIISYVTLSLKQIEQTTKTKRSFWNSPHQPQHLLISDPRLALRLIEKNKRIAKNTNNKDWIISSTIVIKIQARWRNKYINHRKRFKHWNEDNRIERKRWERK